MIDLEISTYWNVETLYYVFNGIAALMGGPGFSGLLKMVFFFGLMIGIFSYAGKQLEMAHWFIQALIFTSLLNLPIARVAIVDKTDLEPPRVVDNVPIALAVVGQTVNLVFGWATNKYETVFGVPESMGLQKGDVAFGHRILKGVNQVIIREPQLRADLMQFIKECTLYDVKDGVITPNQIIGETDTWNTVFDNTSPARFTTYNTLSPSPVTDTCAAAAIVLKQRVNDGLAAATAFYGRQNFSRATSEEVASGLFVNAIGTSYDWILNSSSNASDAMKQAMFNNIWREAGSELPALLNDPARIQELQTMAGAAQAARQADGSNSTLSLLAQETLPHMRNWLEAILYALFPMVVVIMVVVSAEGAKKVIAGYFMSLAWVGLWPVMFAVINHLSLMHLRHKMAGLQLAAGVPFQLTDVFDATLGNEQAAIGYAIVLVPFISGAVIKMAQGGFMSIADKMVSGFASSGASVGSSLAGGNQSMGQTGLDTASVNTTSMHKYDSNVGLSAGGASVLQGNGSTMTIAGNGAAALRQFQNQMLTQMGVERHYGAERSQEGHRTDVTSAGSQLAMRHGEASTFNEVRGHDSTRGQSQNLTVGSQITRTGSETGTHGSGEGLQRQYRDGSSFTASAGAQDTAYMGGNIGAGFGGRGGVGRGGAVGADPANPGAPSPGRAPVTDAAGEKRVAEAMRRTGASQADIDRALTNYRAGGAEVPTRGVVDDFGNLVQVPTGQRPRAAGGSPASGSGSGAQAGANARPQGAGGRGGPSISGGFQAGLQSQKMYSAGHARERAVGDSHNVDENVRLQRSYGVSGQETSASGMAAQSSEGNRYGRDAARSSVDERTNVQDVSDRSEAGTGDRVSRSQSDSFTIRHDLMADPSLLEKVASRNGMTAARLMGQEAGRIQSMVSDFVAEKGAMNSATTMPKSGLSGASMPTNKSDLERESEADRREIPDNINSLHRKKVARTGFSGTASLDVNTSAPDIVDRFAGDVHSAMDPSNPQSVSARGQAIDENAHAWASPDKKLGEGRANPQAIVEDMEGRDVKDTALKVWDRLKGGDGMADGEKLNDNKRRETQADLKIERPGAPKGTGGKQ